MFKKNPRLTIALYVCALLALAYTGFMLFYSYDSITSYYASYNTQAGVSEILTTLISNAFTPFMLSVILYALGALVSMVFDIRNEFEVVADQEESKKQDTSSSEKKEDQEEEKTGEKEENKNEDKDKNKGDNKEASEGSHSE